MEKARNTEEEKKMGQKWVKKEYEASETRINTGVPADTSTLSPMMKEYVKTKEEYSDCILFYRLGDFYEMFFEDALTASRELEITLTGKDCGLEERAPMCGVPFHAAETYINRLIEKGYKVAICEQVEDPKKAKGLVKREAAPHKNEGFLHPWQFWFYPEPREENLVSAFRAWFPQAPGYDGWSCR